MTKIHASLKSASEDKGDDTISKSVPTFMVDPRVVKIIPGFNARPIYPDHVAYFKGLRKAGVDVGHYELKMINGEPHIIEGHHRHAADMELIAEGFEILRVKAIEFKGDEKAAILRMLATQSGLKYEPLQVGEQYVKLVNQFGMTYSEIAAERGMSAQHVKDMIRLTEQPVELKAMINAGEVKAATALKLVKRDGAGAAIETLRQASGVKIGKPITQKVLDGLGKGVLIEAKKNAEMCTKHLSAMEDSPAFCSTTKVAIKDMLDLVSGKRQHLAPSKKAMEAAVDSFIAAAKDNAHSDIQRAAHLLSDLREKRFIPPDNSPEARSYGHHVWLQKMATDDRRATYRAAAHWFLAVLDAGRTNRELAPAPSVLSLEDAMRAEMDSGGVVLAETLCPEHTVLIQYLRGRGAQ